MRRSDLAARVVQLAISTTPLVLVSSRTGVAPGSIRIKTQALDMETT